MKTAVVHDWLPCWGGAENALEQILACHPDADLYTLVDFLDDAQRARLRCRSITTSFIQRLPFARTRFWMYLPLMPYAIEQFDLSRYDLVISSSHLVAKGVLTSVDQPHVAYVYSPARYAWDLHHENLRWTGHDRGLRGLFARWTMHYLRLWDTRTANGVDAWAAVSTFVARRIRKTYGREAVVIHPPVDVEHFALREDKEDFYLCVSRMVPYKGVDIVVNAFAAMPDRRLVVIGDGPQMAALKRTATPNVTLLGAQDDDVVADHMQRARAFVFAGLEDFGIVMVEAQACGTPVIAYGRGGALDSVCEASHEHPTGVLFTAQTTASIVGAVDEFERTRAVFTPRACRAWAERFSAGRFRRELAAFVDAHAAHGSR